MSALRSALQRYALPLALLLMFALTWPLDLAHAGRLPFRVPFGLYLFLGWGFVLAALLMTWLTGGRTAVRRLLKRYLVWRVGWRWYGVAFLLYPAIFLVATALSALWHGAPPDFGATMAAGFFGPMPGQLLFVVPFFLFEAIANGEELGWRGYVLPRLQSRMSPLGASLLLGLIWGFWHLPKYLGPGNNALFGLVMVKCIGDAILYTWLSNNSHASLLLVTIFHAAGNTAAFFLPMSSPLSGSPGTTLAMATVMIWLVAAVVMVVGGPERHSRPAGEETVASAG
jgi:membrane protease YdiL (CAAX protease family)